jgi:hypothetical protein
MSSHQEEPDTDAFPTRDQIARFWEAALERLKIQAERAASAPSDAVKVKMGPIRVVWNSADQEPECCARHRLELLATLHMNVSITTDGRST